MISPIILANEIVISVPSAKAQLLTFIFVSVNLFTLIALPGTNTATQPVQITGQFCMRWEITWAMAILIGLGACWRLRRCEKMVDASYWNVRWAKLAQMDSKSIMKILERIFGQPNSQ